MNNIKLVKHINNSIYKLCNSCNEYKELCLDNFYWHKAKNSFRSKCKKCLNKTSIDYNKKNPEKIIKANEKYIENNKDKIKQYQNERYHKNKDKNKDKRKILQNKYYHNNKEKINKRRQQYYYKTRVLKPKKISLKKIKKEGKNKK